MASLPTQTAQPYIQCTYIILYDIMCMCTHILHLLSLRNRSFVFSRYVYIHFIMTCMAPAENTQSQTIDHAFLPLWCAQSMLQQVTEEVLSNTHPSLRIGLQIIELLSITYMYIYMYKHMTLTQSVHHTYSECTCERT